MVVNVDPFNMQHGFVQVPLADWGLAPDAAYDVIDLLTNERYTWRGEWNYVRLDPQGRMAHILHLQGLDNAGARRRRGADSEPRHG